ncbi:MAG: DUF2332 domain-containing protein [Nocardioidaceae bacterium]
MELVEAFRGQARACAALGSPMYAVLVDRVADDYVVGGVSRTVLTGHEDDPGPSALALRLMGSVHRLVLSRRAGELATYYPSVGGSWEPEGGWAAFAVLLAELPDAVREWLDRPPQTNEVGRAAALMGGLLRIGEEHALPVRLFEIGSSGGLNLRADRYAYTDETGRVFGDPSSPVRLEGAWRGRPLRPWPELEIVERSGSDVMPVDVDDRGGRLTLTAYVWPDQTARLERLRGALQVAARVAAVVRRTDAVSFARSLELASGTTTVLWHSVMWQYLSAGDQRALTARIEELGASATTERPFAHLMLEPIRRTPGAEHSFLVALRMWPGGARRILGDGAAHGIPTVWE